MAPSTGRMESQPGSYVVQQGHEAKIHVQLLVAVEQSESRIVCRKIHFDILISAHHHDILHHASGQLAGEFGEFETVTVKMDGMNVVAGVAHTKTVAPALFQVE